MAEAEEEIKPSAPLWKDIRQLSISAPLFEPTKFESPSSIVELTISANDLLNRDAFSLSDPVCILYLKNSGTIVDWIEVDRTECVKNELSPSFSKKFRLEYKFEERQVLKFKLFDWDGKSQTLDSHDFLGSTECTLAEVVAASKWSKTLQLPSLFSDKEKPSTLTVVSEELGECKKVLNLKVECRIDCKSKSLFGSYKPCLVISKQLTDRSWVLLHKTDRFNLPVSLRISSITSGGNLEIPLKWQVFDKHQNSKLVGAKLIGEFRTNYLHLLQQYEAKENTFELINRSKQLKDRRASASSISAGFLDINYLSVDEEITFLEHIKNGLHLSISVAIDFTISNGDPTRFTSLHYKHGQFDNPYVLAIKIVGEIIEDYSIDKMFPAFGFGAKGFPAGNRVSHNFPINFKQNSPHCYGIEGILANYYRAIKRVKLFGPTCFAPVIKEQAKLASESLNQNENKYHVLLLITDGMICDPDTTKEVIVKASRLPLSIIIIGVGEESFKDMEKLDCDGSLLKDEKGNVAERDIVNFVELKKYVDFKSYKPIDSTSKAALALAVLQELPFQVCEYKKWKAHE